MKIENSQTPAPMQYSVMRIDRSNPLLHRLNTLVPVSGVVGLFLCNSGSIDANIKGRDYHLTKGDMFIITPMQQLAVAHVSMDFSGVAVNVDYEFALSALNSVMPVPVQVRIIGEPCLKLTQKQYGELMARIATIEELTERYRQQRASNPLRSRITQEIIVATGLEAAYRIIDAFVASKPLPPNAATRGDDIVTQFMAMLHSHYRQERNVAFYASQLHLTPNYMSGILKERTGLSALQWISGMVIADAKQKLRYSSMSIKEVAMSLNFPTQSFFGKYFKAQTGVGPKQFRKSGI